MPRGSAAAKGSVSRWLDQRQGQYARVALRIWDLAEVGFWEERSSALLQSELDRAGFTIDTAVASMPTAFVASFGQGRPVVGLLAEFDALPGISQAATPVRKPLEGKGAGHACGHHLFGTGSTAAGIAIGEWLHRTDREGTIRVYGTPAEESGYGKAYMVREGLFSDVDVVLDWHPDDHNDASPYSNLAVKSAKFRFQGVPAHAAGAPQRARSALDGVEAMDFMANMMREHVPQEARIHYVITKGGTAPNVVPENAEVFYYVRHPDPRQVDKIFRWLLRAAEGAALGTGTRVTYEIIGGCFSRLPNLILARVLDTNLRRVGGVTYTAEEQAFAEALRASLGDGGLPLGSQATVGPLEMKTHYTSSDTGDVSWVVPTGTFRAATWVPGTPSHSWQAVAAGGTGIGTKGMMVAAKTLAASAQDLFLDPSISEAAWKELRARRGPDFTYQPLIGDRDPPIGGPT
jgi:aminobenzoyl-glutamate utilization protein B